MASIAGLMEPRIEPEVVFRLRSPIPPGSDPELVLAATEWIAAGFELVHSVFPGWKFAAPDCTAACSVSWRILLRKIAIRSAISGLDKGLKSVTLYFSFAPLCASSR
jgi:hypothetical protein